MTLEQIAACNKLHEAEHRLARWLLMCRDRSEQDTMTLTQEFMADMLGTRRTTVTMVASSLQERGMISYRRGKVTILSHTELAKAACPCYRICHTALRNLYRPVMRLGLDGWACVGRAGRGIHLMLSTLSGLPVDGGPGCLGVG